MWQFSRYTPVHNASEAAPSNQHTRTRQVGELTTFPPIGRQPNDHVAHEGFSSSPLLAQLPDPTGVTQTRSHAGDLMAKPGRRVKLGLQLVPARIGSAQNTKQLET